MNMEKLILAVVILICFALILAWHKTHRPIWWYLTITFLVIVCLWDVARTGKPIKETDCSDCTTSLGQVSFAKDMRIDSTFQLGESHITTTDGLTAMFLTLQQQTIDSLKNELALRDTTDWIAEHSKIK